MEGQQRDRDEVEARVRANADEQVHAQDDIVR